MRKIFFVIALLLISSIVSSCTKDWDIAGSGLGDDQSSSQVGAGQNSAGNSGDILADGVQDKAAEPSTSISDQYDPEAAPPKITDPIMGSAWREFTNAPIQNQPGNRSAEAYLAVLQQFDVANSYPCRYTPTCGGTSNTRCNIYASDVMNAMGAPLPTKGDLGVGHGDAKTTDPMPANAVDTHAWLEKQQDGWTKIDPNNPEDWALLQEHVAAGKPALASHPDHIAVIRPDQPANMAVGNVKGLHIAQAGAVNSNDILVGPVFVNRTVDIYIHD